MEMARIIACRAKRGSKKGSDLRGLITTDMMQEVNVLSRTKPYGRWQELSPWSSIICVGTPIAW